MYLFAMWICLTLVPRVATGVDLLPLVVLFVMGITLTLLGRDPMRTASRSPAWRSRTHSSRSPTASLPDEETTIQKTGARNRIEAVQTAERRGWL